MLFLSELLGGVGVRSEGKREPLALYPGLKYTHTLHIPGQAALCLGKPPCASIPGTALAQVFSPDGGGESGGKKRHAEASRTA